MEVNGYATVGQCLQGLCQKHSLVESALSLDSCDLYQSLGFGRETCQAERPLTLSSSMPASSSSSTGLRALRLVLAWAARLSFLNC